jgi:hypothetical protein
MTSRAGDPARQRTGDPLQQQQQQQQQEEEGENQDVLTQLTTSRPEDAVFGILVLVTEIRVLVTKHLQFPPGQVPWPLLTASNSRNPLLTSP